MNANTNTDSLDLMIKVPAVITIWFWIIKVLATTVGETGADFLIFNLDFGLADISVLMSILLAGFLFVQVRSMRYTPWLYCVPVGYIDSGVVPDHHPTRFCSADTVG